MADTTVSFDLDSLVPARGELAGEQGADMALVEGLQLGEEEAYEALIAAYQQPVYSLVYRLVADPSEACDVVQEVFVKVFRNVESFRGQSNLKTWIYRIAVNEAHNHRRWFGRHRKREVGIENEDASSGSSFGDMLPDPGKSPFELVLHGENMALVEEVLSEMKAVFREAVVLRDIEDLSYEEIAEILQVSLGTVKSRILRGREALRTELLHRLERTEAVALEPQPVEQD